MTRTSLFVPFAVLLAACASPSDEPAAAESFVSSDEPGGPNVARVYIQYNSNWAYQQVLLHRDGTYHVIRGQEVFTGTWAFDLPTSKVTMTPASDSAAPPELEYPVKRVDCEPQGWYPVLMRGQRKMIPYGIDPQFDAQYCRLWAPSP
ncbi:MAG: hypothetical protein KIT84_01660 [Labilithrix sp.]|nr:hypothetical protein [Labilithrix sp.]MCW5809693.1 hypothetical protein [Labilithrix sp.]